MSPPPVSIDNDDDDDDDSLSKASKQSSTNDLSGFWGSNPGGIAIDTTALMAYAPGQTTNTAGPVHNNSTLATNNKESNTLPADQERQVLLLMLLAQVCALHDATPRTFTVHVLELLERGLLENAAVSFLFDLGLVPRNISNSTENTGDLSPTSIRNSLQLIHRQGSNKSESWSVQEHPLSLSRFQREFQQVHPLASGSFGQVFRAMNQLDGAMYAVKRVVCAGLQNFDGDALLMTVVREVQCLAAAADHPHVVRYYTAWLEPSWMTGDTTTAASAETQPLLLTNGSASLSSSSHSTDEWFNNERRLRQHQQALSYDVSGDSLFDRSDCSEWTLPESEQPQQCADNPFDQRAQPSYRYEVCLYIQMQLCQPTTLADWIRNNKNPTVQSAVSIFQQIVSGLAHIHSSGIVHRDIKPANIFRHSSKPDHFLIGDFGLSTLASWRKQQPAAVPAPVAPAPTGTTNMNANTVGESQNPLLLTAGVGTATYAAPEQVATRSYGPPADIFSLGLIFLELCIGPMDTDHERLMILGEVRHRRRVPEALHQAHPEIARIILECTEPEYSRRPSADALLERSFETEKKSSSPPDDIQRRLNEAERQLQECRRQLAEKDATILQLRKQLVEHSTIS